MLKIGEFSKLSRISIRMLRHYDEIGLLMPDAVDDFTGYRYYSEVQLLQAEQIQMLKNMGFGLSMVREILMNYEDAQAMERFLLVKRRETEDELEASRQRIQLLDSTISWLRKDGNMMSYSVTLKTLPERYVASVRDIIPKYECEGQLWHTLMEETAPLNMQDGNPCYTLSVYYDGEFKEQDVDVEVQKSVIGSYPDTEHVKFKTVPPVQMASATFKGPYEQTSGVNAAVAKWIYDNGYEMDGLSFNINHVSPFETQNPEEYVTEVCYPVRKRA